MADPAAQALVDDLLSLTPAKRRKALARMSSDALAGALAAAAEDLAAAERRVEAGKALRLALYQAGREVTPRLTFLRMGQLTGVSEPAVIQTLNKAKAAAST